MRLVDDVELIGRIERHDMDALAELTDVVDAGIRRGVYFIHVLVGDAELVREDARN